MGHFCTHLPDDPEFVLAAQITETNYEAVYLKFPARTHLPLKDVQGHILLVPLNDIGWGWMLNHIFAQEYEPLELHTSTVLDEFTLWKMKKAKV